MPAHVLFCPHAADISHRLERGRRESTSAHMSIQARAMMTLVVALLASSVQSLEIDIPWVKPVVDQMIEASPGDRLVFSFSSSHNVWLMQDAAALSACDFDTATEVAGTDASPFVYTVPADASGALHFACERFDHCEEGQVLTVNIVGECVYTRVSLRGLGTLMHVWCMLEACWCNLVPDAYCKTHTRNTHTHTRTSM